MPRLETAGCVPAFHDAWCLWSEECAAAGAALATPACARIAALLAGDARAFVDAPGTPRHALQTLLYRDPLCARAPPGLLAPLPAAAPAPSLPEDLLRALLAHGAPHAVALAARRIGDWFAATVGTLLLRPGVLCFDDDGDDDDDDGDGEDDNNKSKKEEEETLLRECQQGAARYAVALMQDGGTTMRHRAVGSALLCGGTAVDPAHVFGARCSVAFVVRTLEAAVLGVDDARCAAARTLVRTALRTLLATDDLKPAEAAALGARLQDLGTHARERGSGGATADVLAVLGHSLFAEPAPRAAELLAFFGGHTHGVPLDVRVAALRCLARRLRACAAALAALRDSPAADILWVLVEQYAEEAAAATAPVPPEADAAALLDDVLALRL